MFRKALTMRAGVLRGLGVLGILLAATTLVKADSGIVRVEEDWELRVGEPDHDLVAPQVTCVMAPQANTDGLYAAFTLNHQNVPEFLSGGLQLQLWNGDVPLNAWRSEDRSVIATPGEAITWTQSLAVEHGSLVCAVSNGSSNTWGPFGGDGAVKVSIPTALSSLNAYRPDTSVANSGVDYAGNRVQELALVRVRYFLSNGQVLTDSTRRVVHTYNTVALGQ